MKRVLITLIMVFASTCAWGQVTAVQNDAAKTHEHAASTMKSAGMDAQKMDMMDKCMASMAKALPSAEKNLADMKAALAEMKAGDPTAKRMAELNVQMWEADVAHMKEMGAMHEKMKSDMALKHKDMKDMK